jgi:beta-mannanase
MTHIMKRSADLCPIPNSTSRVDKYRRLPKLQAITGIAMAATCASLATAPLSAASAAAVTTSPVLGVYVGDPNNASVSLEAKFESNYNSFKTALKESPGLIDLYIDYTQPVTSWVSNSDWSAASNVASVSAKPLTPVVGFPLASIASGSATPDAQFRAFAAGTYDTVTKQIVDAWANVGYKTVVFRVGWEMNISGNTSAGTTAQNWADWIAAYQHVYTVLHAEAKARGITVEVVWNPNVSNYDPVKATTDLYPGDAYVDVIGVDMYSDMHVFSDGTTPATYHDWATGGEDTSVATFMANAINRSHYWSYPAATKWSLDSSGGNSATFTSFVAFAELHKKPFAICETGAGNSNAGTDVKDDPTFPQWMASQITTAQAAGLTVAFVNVWNSNGGGNYEFSYSSDAKPLEAAAWGQYIGAVAKP